MAVNVEKKTNELAERRDNMYRKYITCCRRDECLGFDAKVSHGTFGRAELDAHVRAGELLGRHRALAEVVAELRKANEED